jgi:hypothetical protein
MRDAHKYDWSDEYAPRDELPSERVSLFQVVLVAIVVAAVVWISVRAG